MQGTHIPKKGISQPVLLELCLLRMQVGDVQNSERDQQLRVLVMYGLVDWLNISCSLSSLRSSGTYSKNPSGP